MKCSAFCLLILILSAAPAFPKNPQTICSQGVFSAANGEPAPDGRCDLGFKFYTSLTGGSSIREETQSMPVADELFNAVLSGVEPLNLSWGDSIAQA